MESIKKDQKSTKPIRRKKPNFLSRLGQKISKAFSKSKSSVAESKNHEGDISSPGLDDLPVTSKSHDDLKMQEEPYKTKRKNFGSFLKSRVSLFRSYDLSIPQKGDRCLSEGDLTREENKFYSTESSPKPRTGRAHNDSATNDPSLTDTQYNGSFVNKRNIKNELALKLRNKNQVKSKKEDESDSSKTPDSPPLNCSGASPTRNCPNGSRTPYSLSSLSHSSNSLLSGNTACNYAASDGDSMSRSVIDSTDDAGIVVDLTTPINKTTTCSLLDSTAARQKIAASRPRRARPKASDNIKSLTGEKLKDTTNFSPVRESQGILEEISEEDCQPPPSSPTINEENLLTSPCSNNQTNINHKISEGSKLLNDQLSLEEITNVNDKNVPLVEHTVSNFAEVSSGDFSSSNPSSDIVIQPKKSGDSTINLGKIDSFKQNQSNEVSENKNLSSSLGSEPIQTRHTLNKLIFGERDKQVKPSISLRPVNSRLKVTQDNPTNEFSNVVLKRTSWAPGTKVETEIENLGTNQKDDQIVNKPKVNRYTPMSSFKTNKLDDTITTMNDSKSSSVVTDPPAISQNPDYSEKRKSRVCDMVKNLELLSCSDTL